MCNASQDDAPSVPDPTAVTGKELEKSRTTRRRILDAARDLLANVGYAKFSTAAVAEGAGLTRPAMLYHFGSRQELLNATIQFLARRRIELFQAAMAEATDRHGDDRIAIRLAAVDITLDHAVLPEHLAFQELVMAARTDPELAAVVAPAAAYFETMRVRATFHCLPQHMIVPHDFQLVRDVVRLVSEAVTWPHAFTFDKEHRLKALRQFLRLLVASDAGGDFVAAVATSMGDAATPMPDGADPEAGPTHPSD
jgi:AcrR family transcriptional regulator